MLIQLEHILYRKESRKKSMFNSFDIFGPITMPVLVLHLHVLQDQGDSMWMGVNISCGS